MEIGKNKEGMIGLNYPMLNKGNYTAWSIKMKVYMQAQGVWSAVETADTEKVVEEKMDKMALAAIYQSIPEDILLSVADKRTAKEAWKAVKTMCLGAERVKNARIQTLKSEFESLCMKETEAIDDFCMKLNGLVTTIRALGEEVQEAYVVKKLLRAVPSKFLQIASTIEQFGNLETMTVEETVGSLKAHEERIRGTQNDSSSGQLLLTAEEWIKREKDETKLLLTREEWLKRNGKSGAEGSGYAKGRYTKEAARGPRDKSKVRCFNCLGYGHYAAECKKPKAQREQKEEANLTQMTDDEPALLITEKVLLVDEGNVTPKLSQEKRSDSNVWYLDNGASNHMSGQLSKFRKMDNSVKGQVRFGDGSVVHIEGKGTILMKCKNGEERLLEKVYYIPSLCSNIISLGQLAEDGNKVLLKGEYLWVYEDGGKLFMKVKRSPNRLYKIIINSEDATCLLSKTSEASRLWHARLGHVNFKALSLMTTGKMVFGMPEIESQSEVCNGCVMSKQTRRSFPGQATYNAKEFLELIHGDLCGPISPATKAGNKYFLLLVDDYTRIMWVYFLKSKDGALEAFKTFRAKVENGTENRIKTFRTDRGGEFTSKSFNTYCNEAGIYRQLTAPYSPQ